MAHFGMQNSALLCVSGRATFEVGNFSASLSNCLFKERGSVRKQVAEESANNHDCPHLLNRSSIRLFDVPVPALNLEVNAYYELANVDSHQQQPPAIASLTDTKIAEYLKKSLVLQHPCHNHSVEQHVKLVTEAPAQDAGFER